MLIDFLSNLIIQCDMRAPRHLESQSSPKLEDGVDMDKKKTMSTFIIPMSWEIDYIL